MKRNHAEHITLAHIPRVQNALHCLYEVETSRINRDGRRHVSTEYFPFITNRETVLPYYQQQNISSLQAVIISRFRLPCC